MSAEGHRYQKAPTVSKTGLGYQYVRCQRGDRDDTLYIHHLCAIAAGADPHKVFSDAFDTHHRPLDEVFDLEEPVPSTPIEVGDELVEAIDTPDSVELLGRWEHRERNLGRSGAEGD